MADEKTSQDEPDYFGPGHDEAESLFTRELESSSPNDPVLSFMLCGIGDARHLFMTIAIYFTIRKNTSQKVHFTILDHKPVVLARVLIFFYLMQEGGDPDVNDYDARIALLSVSYLFCAQLMPQFAAEKFYNAAEKVEFKLQNEENPFESINIQTSQMKGLAAIIRRWRRDVKTMFPTAQIRREIQRDILRSSLWTPMSGDRWSFMKGYEADHLFFDEFSVVLPPAEVMTHTEPELANLVTQYRAEGGREVRGQINKHLDTYWSINPTLIDFDWEKNKEQQGPPNLGFDPFQAIQCVSLEIDKDEKRMPEAMSVISTFFKLSVITIHKFQGDLMIETFAGDMMDALERIRYDRFERPDPTWPKEYHVIHMSNIPYVHFPTDVFRTSTIPARITDKNVAIMLEGP